MELSPLAKNINSEYFSSMSTLSGVKRVAVYVEGWEDVAFWSNIFTEFGNIVFDIMPPVKDDLSKGKKVVLSFSENAGSNLFLAVDSDFDWIFDGKTKESYQFKQCRWLVQTYTYAIENLQCEPSSLNLLLTKAAKTPSNFDFITFFRRYSNIIYPLFVWYSWAAFTSNSAIFPLKAFAGTVRITSISNSIDFPEEFSRLQKAVRRTLFSLESEYPQYKQGVISFAEFLSSRGVNRDNVYYYMQGHTLKDKVVSPLLNLLFSKYVEDNVRTIRLSTAKNSIKKNQEDYYRNATSQIANYLSDNTGYKTTVFYKMIISDIKKLLSIHES